MTLDTRSRACRKEAIISVPSGSMPPPGYPALPADQLGRKSWWRRYWFIPAGCLSAIVVLIGLVVVILFVVFGAIKSSDPYKEGLARAKSHPSVVEALGTPIEAGFFASGSIEVSGPSGNADLAIPISGPKGKGTVYVVATKSAGEWVFSELNVKIDGRNERIDLLRDEERSTATLSSRLWSRQVGAAKYISVRV